MPIVTSARRTLPSATYRIQLTPQFGFDDAARIVPYLAGLGITHLYCSPYLQAAAGSSHGYDVVDPTQVNAELGGEPGRRRLAETLREHGMSQVLDVVPNHMAIGGRANRWWWDVLENGPASAYAGYFDVDWDPPEPKLRNRILMAILGDHYGRVLEAGQLKVVREGAGFTVSYFEHDLPVAPRSLEVLLEGAARRCRSPELESLAAAFGRLPKATESDSELLHERQRDKEVLKDRLADLIQQAPEVAEAVDRQLAKVNQDPDLLHELLERQNYRLAYWRTAVQELDYRRFFDVDTLVGVRQEVPEVFEASHRLIFQLVEDGSVDGLRIDHPDGLRDPEGYLERLAARVPAAWLVVEKILEPGERLPETWPVAGTTGYDFLNRLTGLFVDPSAEEEMTELYRQATGEEAGWEEVVHERKHQVLREVLTADLARLTGILADVCERHRRYRDYTRFELNQALREVLACFPVYRTYIKPGQTISWQDLRHVVQAVEAAADRRTDLGADLFGFLESLLLLQVPESEEEGSPEAELVMRFQQLSGPVMAKGVEDTAFYNYNRLVALNEVGGNPGKFALSPSEFHAACTEAQRMWSQSMLSTSTHDTKRSEDVRARLAVLSEMPQAWGEAVQAWMKHNDSHRPPGSPVDRNIEYLLYQVLVGAWPLTAERAVAYVKKASKEAKTHTSWLAPNTAYDEALVRFVEDVAADEDFQRMLAEFVSEIVEAGRVNSLAQTLLKLTAPGVPDTYQGTELWDLSLVDPDNRRPVDYDTRMRLLEELDGMEVEEVLQGSDKGLPKLFLIKRALELRRDLPEAFGGDSSYEPLVTTGAAADHALGFTRWGVVATVVPRLTRNLPGWKDTAVELPPGMWRNQLTGDRTVGGAVAVSELLSRFPVALLRLES